MDKPKIVIVGPTEENRSIIEALKRADHSHHIIMESREEFIERKSEEFMPFVLSHYICDVPRFSIATEGQRKVNKKSSKDRSIKRQKKISRRRNRR